MALPDIDGGWRNVESVVIKNHFPDLEAVREKLLPTAVEKRIAIEDYQGALELQGRLTVAVQEAVEKAITIRSQTAVIVYIAGGLTGVDEVTKERYGQTSDLLAQYGHVETQGVRKALFFGYVPHLHGTDPVKHPHVTSQEVRDIDHLWAVVAADLHINWLHPLAHGNAIEEGWGEQTMHPSIYLNPRGNKLSRLTTGMNNVIKTVEYSDTNEALQGLQLVTNEYAAWLRIFPKRDPREFYFMSPQILRDSVLVENGLDPKKWSPVFSASSFLLYVRDPEHPDYGKVGELDGHDWKESGMIFVKFPDGTSTACYDGFEKEQGGCQVSFWLK